MFSDKLNSERRSDDFMEKFFKKYGVILLLYLVIICGILLLNERCRLLNEQSAQTVIVPSIRKIWNKPPIPI